MALDNDLPVLQLVVFDPNRVLDASHTMKMDPNSVFNAKAQGRKDKMAGLDLTESQLGSGLTTMSLSAPVGGLVESSGGGSALENPYLFTGQ